MWARRYLRWIGPERLAVMGYDAATLASELRRIPTTFGSSPSDLFRMALGPLRELRRSSALRWG